jgi:hypothetical protein
MIRVVQWATGSVGSAQPLGLKGGIHKRLVNPGPSCSAYSPRRPLNLRKSSRKRRLVCVSGHVE